MAKYRGTKGNDRLRGTSHNDTFKLTQGGNDDAKGRGGNDRFDLGARFTKSDRINGGGGSNDVLKLKGNYAAGVVFKATTLVNVEKIALASGHDYKLKTHDATVAAGHALTVDASLLGNANALTFDGSSETDGQFLLIGGAGDDVLTGGSQNDKFDLTHGGADTAVGGAGDDMFTLDAAFTTADHIDGGAGTNDTLLLDGAYTIALSGSFLTNVEKIGLAAGHSYNFSFGDDLVVAAGESLNFDGSALGASDSLSVNTANESDGAIVFMGGAGDDTVTFATPAALLASTIDGGADVTFFHDTVVLDGDFSAGVTLAAGQLANFETLKLGAGHSYDLTAADNLVPTGSLDVYGLDLGASDSLSFDGSAEMHGSFYLRGGKGDDTLIGGGKADQFDIGQGGTDICIGGDGNETFYAGSTGWDATDQLNGGAGFDFIYSETSATVNIAFGANSLTSIEQITVSQHFNLGSFTFTMHDANVASGQSMIINGQGLGAANPLSVDASAETDGAYAITAGAANDTLIGGAGNDTLTGGGGADLLTGGAGADTFVYTVASQSTSTTHDTITDLNMNTDKIDLLFSVLDFNTAAALSVDAASFDTDLAAANSAIGPNEACVLHANGGDFANHDFLIIDADGNGDYGAGLDFVIDITGFTGPLNLSLFT